MSGEILTAIGRHCGTGDKASLVRDEKQDATRDLLRFPKPSDGDLWHDPLGQNLLRDRSHHFRADIAGADGVDGDIAACASALVKPISPAFDAE